LTITIKISNLQVLLEIEIKLLENRNIKMKKTSSIKSLKSRDKNNRVVRRRDGKGKIRLYVINKDNPRMKAKQ